MANTILLVEDEENIRRFTKINLQIAGLEVLEAGTGEQGLEIARAKAPDVVILDLMLPGISGYEVCEILRREMPEIGIIMLTARTQDVDRILGLEKGADDYMVKPFNPQELVLRIQSLLRRLNLNDAATETTISEGPYVLDLYARTFRKNGREIDLTPTELAIVRLFISNPGRAFSREEIIHEIWGDTHSGQDKIVDVNIRRVRTKIEDNPAKPKYLETVRSIGYRWNRSA